MYTWGYIKDVCISKLDLQETMREQQNNPEGYVQTLFSQFPFYANEAMTQICSAVKPKYSFAKFVITKDDIGELKKMPNDFISFGDDVSYQLVKQVQFCGAVKNINTVKRELHDDDFQYSGYNEVSFAHDGIFFISYNARWYTFTKNMDDDEELDIPDDILDCLPSYIVSQCFKVDDEYKSSVFRNEYEIMLSRLDNTHFKTLKTIKIEGDW